MQPTRVPPPPTDMDTGDSLLFSHLAKVAVKASADAAASWRGSANVAAMSPHICRWDSSLLEGAAMRQASDAFVAYSPGDMSPGACSPGGPGSATPSGTTPLSGGTTPFQRQGSGVGQQVGSKASSMLAEEGGREGAAGTSARPEANGAGASAAVQAAADSKAPIQVSAFQGATSCATEASDTFDPSATAAPPAPSTGAAAAAAAADVPAHLHRPPLPQQYSDPLRRMDPNNLSSTDSEEREGPEHGELVAQQQQQQQQQGDGSAAAGPASDEQQEQASAGPTGRDAWLRARQQQGLKLYGRHVLVMTWAKK
jgi:hypothetical protein